MSQRLLAVVLLGVLIAAGGCKKKRSHTLSPVGGPGEYSQVLQDFQMQDILNGTKNVVVESPEGRMFDKQQIADVDKPRVTFYKKGAASSVLTAPQGRVHMGSHAIEAWGGVLVVTADSSTLTTERLRYDPESQHLISDDAVRIEKPDSTTVGVGLNADPDLSRVRIGHQKVYVKGH